MNIQVIYGIIDVNLIKHELGPRKVAVAEFSFQILPF